MTRRRPDLFGRAAGIACGVALDRVIGDPRRGHPVAVFGSCAAWIERRLNDRTVGRGALAYVAAVAPVVALGIAAERLPLAARAAATAAATWAVLGGRTLGREATTTGDLVAAGDLPAAREQVTHLVGRVTEGLDGSQIVRAAFESVAENSSDAVVAALFWGGIAGVPGLLGYRAINTLDAMWGHRTERFDRFGRVAARVDDLANHLPARLTAVLVAAQPGVQPQRVWHVVRRDAPAHPSPNAGVVEAAFAAAIGVRIGGRNVYASGTEDRGTLGDGPVPDPTDLRQAVRLLDRVTIAAAACSGVLAVAVAAGAAGRRTTTTATPSRCAASSLALV